MQRIDRRFVLAMTLIVGGVLVAVVYALSGGTDEAESWKPGAEGFLAVATPCCAEASLWDSLDEVTADGQRARPSSAAEAAQWIDDWPYRHRTEDDITVDEPSPGVAAQSNEVRCSGTPTGPGISGQWDDERILQAILDRRECTYSKWKMWTGEATDEQLNERHMIWVDEDGFFHGRVDYWR